MTGAQTEAHRSGEAPEQVPRGEQAAADTELGDLRALQGVSRFPVRVKCALLAWNCLEELVGDGA